MAPSSQSSTDRIEQQVRLSAPRARVWRALTDPQEFGKWFGVKLSGTVAPGATLRGPITHPGYEHVTFEATVETVDPERRVSFRWHPYAIEPGVLQGFDVLGRGGQRHVERLGQLPHRALLGGQPAKHGAPGGIAESV